MTAGKDVKAVSGEAPFKLGASHTGTVLKIGPAAPDRAFDRTIPYAVTAIQQINALHAPADPPSFHLWYAYATEAVPALNQTINKMLQRNGAVSVEDLDRVYDQYLSPGSITGRVERVGTVFGDEVDRVIAMIDAALGSGANYAASLSGANRRLNDARDRDSLREIIETLVDATREVAERNQSLQISLKSSKLEITELQEKLVVICREGLTDPLTTLANRKQFDQTLDQAIKQSEEKRRPFSLLMCDIDHFKKFNDTFGHVMGDQALRLIAAAMKSAVRGQDTPARYGGEEFAVVLPDTALSQAAVVAENLRRAIIEKKVVKRSTGESLGRITVSVGIAQFRRGDVAQTLIERADRCLYAAKHAGRNCVISESELAASQTSVRDRSQLSTSS